MLGIDRNEWLTLTLMITIVLAAEGINTARAVKKLADRAGLEMPITNEVNAVLYDGKPAREAVAELMSRPLREEIN